MKTLSLLFVSLFFIVSCSSVPSYKENNKQIDDNEKKVEGLIKKLQALTKPPAKKKQLTDNWVNTKSIPYKKPLPPLFSEDFTMVVNEEEPVTSVLARASKNIALSVDVEQDIFTTARPGSNLGLPLPSETAATVPESIRNIPKILVSYSGDVRGFFDYIAGWIGAKWRYDSKANRVTYYRYVSESFIVSAQPGKTSTSATVSTQNNADSNAGTKSENTKSGDYSIWSNLEGTIKSMISEEGAFSVGEASGTVFVRDLPHIVENVGLYIKSLNANLEIGIIMDVKVYSVSTENSQSSNINWNALFNNGELSTPPTSLANPSFLLLKDDNNGNVVINNLESVGKVSLVTQGALVSVNHKPTPISVGETIHYFPQVSLTQSTTIGATTSVESESLDVGFSANFLPRVLSNGLDMSLQISMIISRLRSLETISVGTITVERPRVESRQLAPEVLIRSGQTLVIAGLSFMTNEASKSGILGSDAWFLGGSKDTSVLNNQLVVVMTPRIYRPGELPGTGS